ncbi:MAG TPA: hypothetical protein VFJ84_03260 [Candidatus Saccharimonadales bacterium]|nr:hypothetical protein [Candidatus Saccharimonadales bacterium]
MQRLALEFAGVTLQEIPLERPEDFMRHIRLIFGSDAQRQAFIGRMLEIGRQELYRRDSGQTGAKS